MARVINTPRAEADLDDIWLFIAQDNITRADRFIELIVEKCSLLADQPEIGEARPELAPNLRSFPVGNYIIFYQPIEGGIEVVRVLSGYRDISSLFS